MSNEGTSINAATCPQVPHLVARRASVGFVALAVAVGLSLPLGHVSEQAYAEENSAAMVAAETLQTQSLGIFEAPVKLVEALPNASKAKASNYNAWQKAYDALDEAWEEDEDTNDSQKMTESELARVNACGDKLTAVGNAIKKDASRQAAAVKKLKVKSVKAKAASKSAVVSWKSLGKKYEYEVYYSAKKKSGYKLAGSTSGKKFTVKKLKSGKRYYFKVRGYRTDLPVSMSVEYGYRLGLDEIYSKYSAVASVKAK